MDLYYIIPGALLIMFGMALSGFLFNNYIYRYNYKRFGLDYKYSIFYNYGINRFANNLYSYIVNNTFYLILSIILSISFLIGGPLLIYYGNKKDEEDECKKLGLNCPNTTDQTPNTTDQTPNTTKQKHNATIIN